MTTLYDKHFDDIFIAIHYYPASNGEKYAHISLGYYVHSSGKSESLTVAYNEQGAIDATYQSTTSMLNTEIIESFLEDLILNYIA